MSDETLQEMINRLAKPLIDKALAKSGTPAPEPTAEQQLAASQFRERIRDTAIACGALPKSVRFIVRDAEEIFELKDGQVVAKGDAREPLNPLQPLTLVSWLAQLHQDEGHLFEPLAR